MDDDRESTAIFVLPMSRASTAAPVAAWVTTGGWALGAQQVLGSAWILSDSGFFSPQESLQNVAIRGEARITSPKAWRHAVPEPAITLLKDMRRAADARRRALGIDGGPWEPDAVRFVWQRHVLFRRDGLALSMRLRVPLVLSVHALQVAEAQGWGVRRPGWARLVERRGELPQLHAADLVACVSDEVAESVVLRGVPEARVLVTPNGVDTARFRPSGSRMAIRERYGIEEATFVIAWSGSFRRFHGVELALDSLCHLERAGHNVRLLLMGDGQHLSMLERRAAQLGLRSVTFTGSIPFDEMPDHLAACDAGLVLTGTSGGFHYSPVKLREYAACALPIVAHDVGEPGQLLEDRETALLVPPDDAEALASAIARLVTQPGLRAKLGQNARLLAEDRFAWSTQVERTLHHLDQLTAK